MAEVDRLLEAEPITARALQERLAVMRHLYWTADASTPERQAMLMVWTEALMDIPAPFVMEAFREWFAIGTHKPSPGHIRKRALELQAHARIRRENLSLHAMPRTGEAQMREPSEEERRRRLKVAVTMAEAYPNVVKRMTTSKADL